MTILNLCHHPYFTFDGAPTIDDHRLSIAADRYLVASEALLPIAAVPVAGSPYDFRVPRPVGSGGPYNNLYCIRTAPWRPVATRAADGVELTLSTTQAGLHFYDGYRIDDTDRRPRSALCLEAQGWPDALNRPDFPSGKIGPSEVYDHRTEYSFRRI